MPEQNEGSGRMMTTVQDSWRVIRYLADTDTARITEISDALELPKSTVHTHLRTLLAEGFVLQEETAYRLSLNAIRLGEKVRSQIPLYRSGRSEIDRLANETGAYVHLFTYERTSLIYLYGAVGSEAIARKLLIQKRVNPGDFHTMAAGKAMLAFFPESTRDEVIDDLELTAYTRNTVTDPESLREELEQIRRQGFATNDQEEILGTRAVGAPIFSKDGDLFGSISITKPSSQMKGRVLHETVPDQVMKSANAIEAKVQESA